MNLRFGLTLLIILVSNLFLCIRQPSLLTVAAPLGYLLAVAVVLLWILSASRMSPKARRHVLRHGPAAAASQRPLRTVDILSWEFEYARITASEAMRDRQSVVNFYLAIAGALPTAVALLIIEGPGLEKLPAYHTVGAVILWALVIIGWMFFLQVIQLRRSWYQSALAMNRIKDFYLEHSGDLDGKELAQAFQWNTQSLPPPEKRWNIFFFSAALIAFLNSLCFMFGGFLIDVSVFDIAKGGAWPFVYWAILFIYAVSMFSIHIVMYNAFLREPGEEIPVMPSNPKPAITPQRRVEVLDRHRDYDGLYKIDRVRFRFEKFDGTLSEPVTRLVFERGDSVCVLPYDPAKDQVLLIQQFRYPAYVRNGPGWLWEIVAGVQDKDRDRVAVAHAELMEEAGFVVETLVPITNFYLSPGGSSERIYLYLAYVSADNLIAPGGGLAGENEDISVSLVPFPEAMKMLETGAILDAKTVIALQWLALHKNSLPRLPRK